MCSSFHLLWFKSRRPAQHKLDGQRQVQELEKKRTQKRRNLFDEQDRIDEKRQELIEQLASRLEEDETTVPLFTVR